MTIDPKCYAWARIWLLNISQHTTDIDRLAQRIQDTCEDFEADLEKEQEARHDRS